MAQLVDWLCEACDAWEWDNPLTAKDLAAADPLISQSRMNVALKYLVKTGVLYSDPEENRVVYRPESKRPVSDIQRIICKGLSRWQEGRP